MPNAPPLGRALGAGAATTGLLAVIGTMRGRTTGYARIGADATMDES
jgi:hypothetical protein